MSRSNVTKPIPPSAKQEKSLESIFSRACTQKMLIRNGMRKICKSTSHCWGLIRELHENSDCRAIFTGKSYCKFPANLMLHRFFFFSPSTHDSKAALKDVSEAEKMFLFCVRKNKEIKIARILEVVLKFFMPQRGIKLLNFVSLSEEFDERNFGNLKWTINEDDNETSFSTFLKFSSEFLVGFSFIIMFFICEALQ